MSIRRLRYCIGLFGLLVNATAYTATGETFRVVAGYSDVVFSASMGVPLQWDLCQLPCASDDERRVRLFAEGDGGFAVTEAANEESAFEPKLRESDTEVEVSFVRAGIARRYIISRNTPEVRMQVAPGSRLSISTGRSFVPESLPGFGQIYSRVSLASVTSAGQEIIAYDAFEEAGGASVELQREEPGWAGIRNRYWAFLVQMESTDKVAAEYSAANRPAVEFASGRPRELTLYAGPVAWDQLSAVSDDLSEMLFAALWDFLRWLCFGMLLLLEFLHGLVGNYGVAIILLSLSAKILLSPLTMLADRWQQDVNRIQTLLKPELDEIKRNFKGEEAHEKTLAVYKKHDVSMFYTFKSAAGFLIQIPVFIAAFDVLAENISLNEIAFLWIADLAKPDRLTELPFVMPFFGGYLNLLPFLMTFLSGLAAWLQAEESLSPELQRQQSLRLYLMAAAFFVLFYTFPAGMVLYWTSSNLFHLIKVEAGSLLKRGQIS